MIHMEGVYMWIGCGIVSYIIFIYIGARYDGWKPDRFLLIFLPLHIFGGFMIMIMMFIVWVFKHAEYRAETEGKS